MAESLAFKSNARTPRTAIVEEDYRGGMSYTDSALEGNFVKMLLNYNFKDDGVVLIPRGGLTSISSIPVPQSTAGRTKYPFAALTTNVELFGNTYIQDYRTRAFMTTASDEDPIVLPQYSPNRKAVLFPNTETNLFMQDPSTDQFTMSKLARDLPGETASTDPADQQDTIQYLGEGYVSSPKVHGFNLGAVGPRKPIHTVLNNVAYILYKQNSNNTLGFGKLRIVKNASILYHKCEPVKPMKLTVKEVLGSGYNMLLPDPYVFSNSAAPTYSIDGILPYTIPTSGGTKELLLSARPGQKINFEVYYHYKQEENVKLRARWEVTSLTGTEWTCLQTQLATNTADAGAAISADYTPGASISINMEPTANQFQVRVSLYRKVAEAIDEKPVKVMLLPIYKLVAEENTNTKNLQPAKYNLATASGMTAWKQRIVLWGVSGAENILFTSDVNNPTYFPYPNNIDIFDENIIHCVPYQDSLLVFTETHIFMLTLMEDGIGFTSTVVQNRLSISPMDRHVIQVIKNLIYFKSDNYYYMIVPKTNSIKGELLIAPISRPIVNLLDNFEDAIRDTLDTVYFKTIPAEYNLGLINYTNYVDNTVVRNVYTFQATCPPGAPFQFAPFNFNFVLNYDTSARTWTAYCYQCNYSMIPFKETITDTTTLLDVCNNGAATVAQLIQTDPHSSEDTFQLSNVSQTRVLPNYQYLDTGYRKMGAQHKKVFREIQMKINNVSQRTLDFYTEFMLDDQVRKTYYTYAVQHITDPSNPNYGLLYVDRVFKPSMVVAGATVLGEAGVPEDYCWQLNVSKLANISTFKTRFPVSGRGYAPRLKLISFNEQRYELLNINWVFRTMYMR